MRAQLEAIIEQLKSLKSEGLNDVLCTEETLRGLSKKLTQKTKSIAVKQARANSQPLQINLEDKSHEKEAAPIEIKIKVANAQSLPTAESIVLPQGNKETQWNWLKEKVLSCEVAKKEIKPGKKIVLGVGNLNADIFFCGEAPGADEEIQGEPFVGKAGQLLTKIIQAMGLSREEVYIGNIMNWRPKMPTAFGNRPPTQEEMRFCLPNLIAQLEIVKPKVIVALGATAVNGLLGEDSKRRMGDIRGKWDEFNGIPLMVTFHPSYLLRNNTLRTKRMVWEDMLMVMERLKMPISEKQQSYFT